MNNFFPDKNDIIGWIACVIGFIGSIVAFCVIIADLIIKVTR